jgi:hypothetical protein
MTVGQLSREMASWELTEWAGYYKVVAWEDQQRELEQRANRGGTMGMG